MTHNLHKSPSSAADLYFPSPRASSSPLPFLCSPPLRPRGGGSPEENLQTLTTAADSGGGSGHMEGVSGAGVEDERKPLSEVVGDCVQRWFQDALKEARRGDTAMQVLVAQMYHSGYGIPKNEHKGRAWIEKASRYRSSVWKVGTKRPGYNASDSDSDEANDNSKQYHSITS